MPENAETPSQQQGRQSGPVQPAAQPQQPEPPEQLSKDARTWAMFCHLAGLAGLLPIIPLFGSIIGPLIIWQLKKDESPFVDEQGKEAVNFQITMAICAVVSLVLILVLIGLLLLPAVIITDIVLLLIAAVKANEGVHYRYPLSIRFIK